AKKKFLSLSSYIPGAYDDDKAFANLNSELEKIEKDNKGKSTNRLFYMALPPNVFTVVAAGLKKNCYVEQGNNRIVIEKPFGKDLESSREMMGKLKDLWKEEETFRIDHYLGKEMVKNLLVMRFGNPVVDVGLNNKFVDNVQITFKEPFGTEGRGGYFDEFGIIRDIQQNHLTQVLSLLAMDAPKSLGAEDIRDQKVKVLESVPPIDAKDVLIGQYSAANGKPGYKDDDTVPKDSNCPTFAALVLWVNNERWKGVPFVLKAGKALDEGQVSIRVQYKDAEGPLKGAARNELVLRVQPNEAVYYKINAKTPGLEGSFSSSLPADLDLTYKQRFENIRIPEAYEALILDALNGDHSNFVRDDELDASWKIFTPILHAIDAGKVQVSSYPYGSRGPSELNEFLAKYGYRRSDGYEWPKTNVANVSGKM
ncbi:glucose-6-phosphate dehydrogenase, partial [Ceraceosorus guamensis]